MDDYTKCLKQVLLSELNHLECKERMYKEIYDESFDEYLLKEKEINDKIAVINREKHKNNTFFMRKMSVLVPMIVLVSGTTLVLMWMGLSSLGIIKEIAMILSLVVTIGGVAPLFFKIFNKKYDTMYTNDRNYDEEIGKLKNELLSYENEMKRTQMDYLAISSQVSQLQDEIDELDDSIVTHQIDGDTEVITVSRKPFVRKLVIEK